MYEALSQFAQTGGLLMFVAIFVAVLVYALWPKNQAKFDAAANMALHDDAPVNDENEDKPNV
jgi:cytochrome c oxidase cbb3-type subunit IV